MLDKACNRGSWVRVKVREYGLRAPSLIYFLIALSISGRRSCLSLLAEHEGRCSSVQPVPFHGGRSVQLLGLTSHQTQPRCVYQPDLLSFNLALSACARRGDANRTLRLLGDMRRADLLPTTYSFSSAVKSCERAGKADEVLALLGRMKSGGVSRTLITFNSALLACAKDGRREDSLRILSEMKKEGVSPDGKSFRLAMQACGRAGDPAGALSDSAGMAKAGIPPGDRSFASAMEAFALAGDVETVLSLGEARAASLSGDGKPYWSSTLTGAKACAAAGRSADAVGLLRELPPDSDDDDLCPDRRSPPVAVVLEAESEMPARRGYQQQQQQQEQQQQQQQKQQQYQQHQHQQKSQHQQRPRLGADHAPEAAASAAAAANITSTASSTAFFTTVGRRERAWSETLWSAAANGQASAMLELLVAIREEEEGLLKLTGAHYVYNKALRLLADSLRTAGPPGRSAESVRT
ncbi:unnamed protein product [Ectocarpus sp. 6 AP-2014]